LNAAGYDLPLDDIYGVQLVGGAEDLLVAASLLERLVAQQEPTVLNVGIASSWRKQAEVILAPVMAGKFKVGSNTVGEQAGVSNGPSVFTDSGVQEFIDGYGGVEGGGGLDDPGDPFSGVGGGL
jgi:hypothetical protein